MQSRECSNLINVPARSNLQIAGKTSLGSRALLASSTQICHDLVRCSQLEARALLPESVAQRLCALPLAVLGSEKSERTLVVCCGDDLSDPTLVQELRFVTECEIELEAAPAAAVSQAITQSYRISDKLLQHALSSAARAYASGAARGAQDGDSDAVPRIADLVVERAIALRASDIHFEYSEVGVSLRYRVDGVLRPQDVGGMQKGLARNLARCVKVRSGLDITVEHHPQEGSFALLAHPGSVRLSIIPVVGGEKLVMRLFLTPGPGFERGLTLDELGLRDQQSQLLHTIMHLSGGVLLFSGPTGSGKSTLLRAVLQELKDVTKNIVSIEDPVEQVVPFVTHLQVDRHKGLDYCDLLAPVLRQDPDVLVVGEIRDAKTAEMVLTAGITGHLVISTVHAGSSLDVLLRLRQFGLPWDLIALSVRLVSSQRLIGLICSRCRAAASVSAEFCTTLSLPAETEFFVGQGCEQCLHSGIFGRIGLFEFLPLSSAVRSQLLGDSSAPEWLSRVYQSAKDSGYEPLPIAIRKALADQMISPRSALSALGIHPSGLLKSEARKV